MTVQPRSITLRFELTYDEYVEACRASFKKQPQRWVFHVGWWGIFALGIVLWLRLRDSRDWDAPLALMVLALAQLLSQVWSTHSEVEKGWKEYDRVIQPATVEVGEEGVRYETPLTTIWMTWASFSDFIESRGLFLLYSTPTEVHLMLPKRGLVNPDQLEELRGLLKEKLQRVEGAFEVALSSEQRGGDNRDRAAG